jgi:catechol 2,3-dioxygenase-like lactoylglutathione lyase family enzyme
MSSRPLPEHAHAVLHFNLNTCKVEAAEAFYYGYGLTRRMWSDADDSDARPMGLSESTSSRTSFLYDDRGPRAAPALELVEWRRPPTADRNLAPEATTGLQAIGMRMPGLSHVDGVVSVQGIDRPVRRMHDADGVRLELVVVPDAEETPCLAYVRMTAADLDVTRAWYGRLGFVDVANAPGRLSLVLPSDPTFSLEISANPTVPRSTAVANTRGLYRIALAVEDVQAARGALTGSGWSMPEPVHIPMPDTPTGGFTVLFLRDPDGVVVEFVHRPRSSVRRPTAPTSLRTPGLKESA